MQVANQRKIFLTTYNLLQNAGFVEYFKIELRFYICLKNAICWVPFAVLHAIDYPTLRNHWNNYIINA